MRLATVLMLLSMKVGIAQFSLSLNPGFSRWNMSVPVDWQWNYPRLEYAQVSLEIEGAYVTERGLELGLKSILGPRRDFLDPGATGGIHIFSNNEFFSYWFEVKHRLNTIAFVGYHSDLNRRWQTYARIDFGYYQRQIQSYWSVQDTSNTQVGYSENHKLHQFCYGYKFGLSYGKRLQVSVETSALFIRPINDKSHTDRRTSFSIGLKYFFREKKNKALTTSGPSLQEE